jgi:hypothetical protein
LTVGRDRDDESDGQRQSNEGMHMIAKHSRNH